MANRAEARAPERRSLEEIARVAKSPTQAKLLAIREGYSERQGIKCSAIRKGMNAKEGDALRTSGRISVWALAALALSGIFALAAGCGNYKDGDYNQLEDLNSAGDLGRLLGGKDKPLAKWGPAAPSAPVQVIQFFGVAGRPGFWSDGQLALAPGSRHIFVNADQPGLAGMLGAMAIIVSGVQSGQPIAVAPTANFAGWHDKIFTNVEIPDSVRTIKAVKVDANGAVVAEADKTYTVRFEGDQFFTGDSEQLSGVPDGAGSIYFDRFNVATSVLSIRTAGKKVQVLVSSDDGKSHILGNEDVNGWSGIRLEDVNGNPVTTGAVKVLLLELNADGSVKGFLDVSKAKFAADIPVTGSSVTKKGIALFVDKGIVYLNSTAANTITVPALASLTTSPVKATIPVGDTFVFDDVLGVFAGGYRTSVRYSTEMIGNSSLTGVASVSSALSRKGESAGTANQTMQIGTIVSAPATELTVFESFLELSVSFSQIFSEGKSEIKAILHKRGEQPRNVSKDPATRFVSDKPALLTMSGNVGTGGSQGNPIVTVTFEGTTKTVSIQVLPKPRFIEARIPKTTFIPGEEFTPDLIVALEGSPNLLENKASTAKWSSSSAAVAITVADGGKTTTQLGGGKAKLTALYFGLRVETEEFTVTAPVVATAITPSSASITLANTATVAADVTCTTGLSDSSSRASANLEVTLSAGAPVTATVAGNKVSFLPIANRSGSGTATIKETGSTPTATVSITVSAVLASIDPIANLTLQVGTSSQLPGLTGKLNNSADSGGATTVALAFNKVTFSGGNVAALGLVTADTTVGTATITTTSVDVTSVTRTFTVTTSLTPPPVTVTSVTATPATITFANTATTAAEATCTTGLSDGSSRASANLEVTLSTGAPVTATVTGNRVSFLPIANRSGSGTATIKETGATPTATVSITVSAVLASIDPIANLTLQVGTASQLPGLTGKLNDSANSGGATTVTLAFNKVTSSSTDGNVASVNASGLVTAGSAAAVATITMTSVDVPSVTRTFTVTVTPAAVGTHGDPIAGGTLRIGFDGNNPDGTTNVDLFFSQAKVPGDKSSPFVLLYRPDTAPTAPATNSALTTVATASDGSLWWKMTVTVRTSGEQLILNYGGKYPTSWASLSGSTLYNSGTPGDGLTPIITPSALTVVKGLMR